MQMNWNVRWRGEGKQTARVNWINHVWNDQIAASSPRISLNWTHFQSRVVSRVQFNPPPHPPTPLPRAAPSNTGGPRRITSVSIKTDQYRVTRSRGGGKYPTKSFDTRTTLRQRRPRRQRQRRQRQQPLYWRHNRSVFQQRAECGATAGCTVVVVVF